MPTSRRWTRGFGREHGLTAKGEGWMARRISLGALRKCCPPLRLSTRRSAWLAPQRLDIFVPALSLAIEYQGEQHFLPLDHLGGDAVYPTGSTWTPENGPPAVPMV